MEILIKILQLILSLSLLVFVHELGHYISARMFGIRVDKFYLFFDAWGFSLVKFKIGDTTFGIGWIPFGGYCSISGMVDERMNTEAMQKPAESWEYRAHPAWQRLIVTISGVVLNVVAALVIYIGMSWHWGNSYIDNKDLEWGYAFNELGHEVGFEDGDRVVSFDGVPVEGNFGKVYHDMVVGGVERVGVLRGEALVEITIYESEVAKMLDSPDFMTPRMPFVVAEDVGDFLAGDSLVAFNGVPMTFFNDYRAALAGAAGDTVSLTAVRNGIEQNIIAPVSDEGLLGVGVKDLTAYFPIQTIEYNFWRAVPEGFRRTGAEIGGYWQQLKMIFSPRTEAYKSVGSLISIGNIFPGTWDWYSFWRITAFLSIILAVMNILPIPALDGGHALFAIWEMVTRRKPSDKVLERAQMVGMILLLALMALAFWNDIYRFFIK